MSKLILYHGSPEILKTPAYGKGKTYNDYGQGFYCTQHLELAMEWACSQGVDGYANRYAIETKGLQILNLSSDDYTVLNWLAILLENRQPTLSSPIEKRGREYLLQNFLPEYKSYYYHRPQKRYLQATATTQSLQIFPKGTFRKIGRKSAHPATI